ncbi:MAG: 2-oxoglutarate dehydrogenase E1 subunit family protein, partial [Actinomycetota bacterium]
MLERPRPEDFGANSWLVEEMYERFRENPSSVGENWREFFSDFKPAGTPRTDDTAEIIRPVVPAESKAAPVAAPVVTSPGVEPPKPRVTQPTEIVPDGAPEPLRGVSAAIATNMDR